MSSWRRFLRRAGGRQGQLAAAAPVKLIDFATDATFSRTTEASVFDSSSGVLTCYGVNELRPGLSLAYTLEGAGTNLVTAPDDLSDAAWNLKVGSTFAYDVAATPDASAGTVADRIIFDFSNRYTVEEQSVATSTDYTYSHFARTESGTLAMRAYMRNWAGASAYTYYTANTQWQRVALTQNSGTGATTPRIAGVYSDAGGSMLWTHNQTEASKFATSYMCDSSGTRGRDILYVPSASGPGTTLSSGRWFFECIPAYDWNEYNGTANVGTFPLWLISNYVRLRNYSNGSISFTSATAGNIEVTNVSWVKGDRLRIEVEPGNGEVTVYKNGVWVGTQYGDAFTIADADCYYGSNSLGTAQFYGEISDIYEVPVADGDPLLDYTQASVTRASLAWNRDTRGGGDVWYEFSSGEPRVLNDGALYVGGTRTNTCLHCNALDNVVWTLLNSATRTANAGASINKTVDADAIQFTASASDGIEQTVAGHTGAVTWRVYLKSTGGNKNLRLQLDTDLGTASKDIVVTNKFKSFSITQGHTSGNVVCRILNDAGATAGEVLACYAQLEQAVFASAPITTTAGSVTRATDIISYSGTPAIMREGIYQVTVNPKNADDGSQIHHIFYSGTGADYLALVTPGTSGTVRLRCNGINYNNAVTWDSTSEITITVDWVSEEITIAGALTGNGTFSFAGATQWPAAALYIGDDHVANINRAFFGAISQPRRVIP